MSNLRSTTAPLNQNLQNLSGRTVSQSVAAQGTQTEKNILAAGQRQFFPMTGEFFYVEAASGQVNISPQCAYGKGPENPYGTGTGLRVDRINAFTGLHIRNPSATETLFFQIKVGFDSFIDNRFISTDFLFSQINLATYGPQSVQIPLVTITDLSGTIIIDNNGNQWYAVNRQLLCLFNQDGSEPWYLMNTAANVYLGYVPIGLPIQLPTSGNFKLKQGVVGSTVDGTITEIYNCLPKLGL